MGYHTNFVGRFTLDKPLTPEHLAYLKAFVGTRRMKRDEEITARRPDPVREAVGLPVGTEGEYYVGEGGFRGQCESFPRRDTEQLGILDYNHEPCTQPGLWCGWEPTECGNYIQWDGAEKFYCYEEWLRYLVENFLRPWGYVLNGEVAWAGESHGDDGTLYCIGNHVTSKEPTAVQMLATAAVDWETADRDELDNRWRFDEDDE